MGEDQDWRQFMTDRSRKERKAGPLHTAESGVIRAKVIENVWRRVPESNRCTRICNPLRHHSANSPRNGSRGLAYLGAGCKPVAATDSANTL